MWAMGVTNYLGSMETVKGLRCQDKMKVLIKILHHHRSQGCGTVVRVMVSVNSEPINLGFNVRLNLLNLLFEIGPWNIKGMGSPIHRSSNCSFELCHCQCSCRKAMCVLQTKLHEFLRCFIQFQLKSHKGCHLMRQSCA